MISKDNDPQNNFCSYFAHGNFQGKALTGVLEFWSHFEETLFEVIFISEISRQLRLNPFLYILDLVFFLKKILIFFRWQKKLSTLKHIFLRENWQNVVRCQWEKLREIRPNMELICQNMNLHGRVRAYIWPVNSAFGGLYRIMSNIYHGAFYENSWRLNDVSYFCKKFHLRCLTEFWVRLWYVVCTGKHTYQHLY